MTPSTTPLSESAAAEGGTRPSSPTWKIELLYDGACPLCLREVDFLRKQDAGRGLVSFVDIADEQYAAEAHGNVDFETAMGRIHAVLPDGTVIKNVEVFRRTYSVLGIGWIYAATNWPIIRPLVNKIYDIWADYRLALTGRPNLATIVDERQKRLEEKGAGRCRLDK